MDSKKRPAKTARLATPSRAAGPPGRNAEPSSDLWKFVAAGALVAGPGGYFLRKAGKEKEAKIEELKKPLFLNPREYSPEQMKQKRADVTLERELLTETAGRQVAGGTSLLLLSFGAAIMVVLLGLKIRPRRAALAFGPFLLLAALWSVYEAGIITMVISSLLGVALVYYVTGEKGERNERAFQEFRRFPMRRQVVPEIAEAPNYRAVARSADVQPLRLLRRVPSLPAELARMLPSIGEGRAHGFLQLKADLAYVALVESDGHASADYATVLLVLEEAAPRFVARPLPIVDGAPIPNPGLKFSDDPAFASKYWVQVPPNQDPRAVRAFLAPIVREELLSLPIVWLHAQGRVLALTIFGPYDPETLDHLVDVADVLFAELGAAGGPSLLEPDDPEVPGETVKVKPKKKKKGAATSASGASAAPT